MCLKMIFEAVTETWYAITMHFMSVHVRTFTRIYADLQCKALLYVTRLCVRCLQQDCEQCTKQDCPDNTSDHQFFFNILYIFFIMYCGKSCEITGSYIVLQFAKLFVCLFNVVLKPIIKLTD